MNFQEFNIKLLLGPILIDIILGDSFIEPTTFFTSDIHKHFFYEVQFFIQGEGIITIDNEDFIVEKNSYFIIGPDVYHSQKDSPSNPISKYCFKFEYSINDDNEYYNYTPKKEIQSIIGILSGLRYFHAKDLHGFISQVRDINNEIINQKLGYYTKLQSQFLLIMMNIIRDIAKQYNRLNISYEFPHKSPLELRSKNIDYFFNNNYNKDVTSEDLCNLLKVSKSQLNRILKKHYNASFKQKLIETRMNNAKKLLMMKTLTIQDISERIGYSSAESFSSAFKQKFGISPNTYRGYYLP